MNVRGVLYQFESFEALEEQLDIRRDEQEFLLPNAEGLRDGEWVLATFSVGEESTSLAARAVDQGEGLHLVFTERDWERLSEFAGRGGPISLPPQSMQCPAEPIEAPPNSRVLVVDDDEDVRGMLGSMLESAGFAVDAVATAEEALEHLRQHPPDLLVLDCNLPGMNGIELVAQLRQAPEWGSLPVLFLSSLCSQQEVAAAFDAGADDFVGKPFRVRELGARILGLLKRSQQGAGREPSPLPLSSPGRGLPVR